MPFLGRRKPVDIKALRKASSALAPKHATCSETRLRSDAGNVFLERKFSCTLRMPLTLIVHLFPLITSTAKTQVCSQLQNAMLKNSLAFVFSSAYSRASVVRFSQIVSCFEGAFTFSPWLAYLTRRSHFTSQQRISVTKSRPWKHWCLRRNKNKVANKNWKAKRWKRKHLV